LKSYKFGASTGVAHKTKIPKLPGSESRVRQSRSRTKDQEQLQGGEVERSGSGFSAWGFFQFAMLHPVQLLTSFDLAGVGAMVWDLEQSMVGFGDIDQRAGW
jgi:hypothetical protein